MKSLLEKVFFQANIGILVVDRQYNIVLCNYYMADYTKTNSSNIVGNNLFEKYKNLPEKWLKQKIDTIFLLKNSSFISWEQRPYLFDFASSRPITGIHEKMIQNCSLIPIVDDNNGATHVCITVTDVTETAQTQAKLKSTSKRLIQEKEAQQKLIEKLEEAKNQLLQSEKMASIGQLAAGVAHEINNPVGFIKSNFNSLNHYTEQIKQTLEKYNNVLSELDSPNTVDKIRAINEEHDIDFVTDDIKNLLNESFDGISRIEEIVKSLKHFSRADSNQWEEASINDGIESTLKVVSHELKYIASIEKIFGDLPMIQCMPMQINQVFMNLLINAGQAMDRNKNDGKIIIKTEWVGDNIVISITDNGRGISEQHLLKIFDPFFTTKPVGQGTGLGLSLSYNIIKKHHGDIVVHSSSDSGTIFTITLPVKQHQAASGDKAE
jgi:two-component system NtrC family sensor kinase